VQVSPWDDYDWYAKLKLRACIRRVPTWTYGMEPRYEEGVNDCEMRCRITLLWRVLFKERENKLKQEKSHFDVWRWWAKLM